MVIVRGGGQQRRGSEGRVMVEERKGVKGRGRRIGRERRGEKGEGRTD